MYELLLNWSSNNTNLFAVPRKTTCVAILVLVYTYTVQYTYSQIFHFFFSHLVHKTEYGETHTFTCRRVCVVFVWDNCVHMFASRTCVRVIRRVRRTNSYEYFDISWTKLCDWFGPRRLREYSKILMNSDFNYFSSEKIIISHWIIQLV